MYSYRKIKGTEATRFVLALLASLTIASIFPSASHAGTDVPTQLGGNEPTTAAVNPRSPNIIAVARGLTVAISTDFGRTFPAAATVGMPTNPPTFGGVNAWQSCGDPSVTFDSQGRLFMSYLLCGNDNAAPPNRLGIAVYVQQIQVQVNAATNVATVTTVGAPSLVSGNAAINNDDKEWIVADANPDSPFRDNLYVVWTRLNTSQVVFSRSTNQGANWSGATAISAAGEGFVWPSHIAAAQNGDVYVTYHTHTCEAGTEATARMNVLRDSNGGAQLQAGTGFQTSWFQVAVSCNRRSVSTGIANANFWMQGANQGFVIPDPVRPGNVYVVANDDPNDNFTTGDGADVVLARSTDYGQTWSIKTVSHEPAAQPGTAGSLQVYPTGAIDQLGNLVVAWWDTRRGFTNAAGSLLLDQYATVSRDGGLTFTNDFRVSDLPFDPDLNAPCRFGPAGPPTCGSEPDAGPNTLRIGEYNGVAAANGTAYIIWTGNQTPPNPQATPPTAAAGNQTTYFDAFTMLGAFPDDMEPNDAWNPGVASVLGADGTYQNQDLTIHSDTDEDWFKVTALSTGELFFTLDYNSRFADLDLEVRDKFNNVITTRTTGVDTSNVESIFIPAVAGQDYFVRVFAEPGQVPPLNTYDLGIVNTPAPVPFGIVLAPGSDTGANGLDNITKNATPTILLAVDLNPLSALSFSPDDDATLADDAPGYKIEIYRNGNAVGRASPVGAGDPGVFAYTFTSPLSEGVNFITARVVIVDRSDTNGASPGGLHAVGQGGESGALVVTLDTTAPGAGALGQLDLLPTSDSGGIDDDDITTFSTPSFGIQVNEPGFVRIFATNLAGGGPVQVAQFQASTTGVHQVTVQSLADGVYNMTATIEDAAGNVGSSTAPLKVTIAKFSLTLPGLTSTGPGPVTVDLAGKTIQGFTSPHASGTIGIAGIPTVNLNVGGQTLSINLTGADDSLNYTPSGSNAGSVALAGVSQTINFSNSGLFTVNPLAGNDTVTTIGTAAGDTVNVTVNTTATVQVGSTLKLNMPAAEVEKIGISTLQGNDTVNVSIFDTVNAALFVDGGEPTTVNKGNDVLNLFDMSAGKKGNYSNISGGSTAGAGAVVLTFKAAGYSTRVDYSGIEKQTRK
jgi:hypothetical protein